ncbi:IbrB-like domain-containing protein [Aeromonas enteropelogenes]|uniref:IbrB-like domain-containing protein n=1 Tax=Aeromonas enteropelogenes TaxID=29489 RepID=UPI003B9FD8B5
MENNLTKKSILSEVSKIINELDGKLSLIKENELISTINDIREIIAKHSPFSSNPIENVQWIHHSELTPNDYNPNKMAPTEKKLLEVSISENGFTQPVVVQKTKEKFIIVDGYHRHAIVSDIKSHHVQTHGYVPVVILEQNKRAALIAATVRHNRARGSHQINLMSEIVKELSQLGLSNKDIGVKLGMDSDEVLRLRQITGLCELFSDVEFSTAWTVE